jgi:hypothetical protein
MNNTTLSALSLSALALAAAERRRERQLDGADEMARQLRAEKVGRVVDSVRALVGRDAGEIEVDTASLLATVGGLTFKVYMLEEESPLYRTVGLVYSCPACTQKFFSKDLHSLADLGDALSAEPRACPHCLLTKMVA